MKTIYILEHCDRKLFPWSLIEYKRISKFVGKNNIWFTNIKEKDKKKLKNYGKIFTESATSMLLHNVCILDPESKKVLSPKDKSKFNYLIIGGILGDYPPQKRTEEYISSKMFGTETRNLGKEQLSTDNAVYVAHKIMTGTPLGKIKFTDNPEIKINKIESVTLPFRYPLVNDKPLMSSKIISHLKKHPGF